MADVFISYAREDRETAQKIATALEAVGYSVWWDREILGGENFDEALERELDLASAVIVLWSKRSASSNWVRREAAAAVERGVLVPAFIEQVKLPLEFRRKQTIDLTSWRGAPSAQEFDLIRRAIAAHVPQGATRLQISPLLAGRTPADSTAPQISHFLTATASILRAVREVSAVKYALGVAGIGAALAISSTFFTATSVVLTGIGIMLPLMILLVVFAAIASLTRKVLRSPALFFMWSTLFLFLGSVALFASSVFFKWPLPIEYLLNGRSVKAASNSSDYCRRPPHDWWNDWHIEKNMPQLNLTAVPHGFVEQLSDKMFNRPSFAMGSVLVLHPLSQAEPAEIAFTGDLKKVAGKTMTLVAAGSPYGDGELQVVANSQIIMKAIVDGSKWLQIRTPLPDPLLSLQVRSAAGGVAPWYFETTFSKHICFTQ